MLCGADPILRKRLARYNQFLKKLHAHILVDPVAVFRERDPTKESIFSNQATRIYKNKNIAKQKKTNDMDFKISFKAKGLIKLQKMKKRKRDLSVEGPVKRIRILR